MRFQLRTINMIKEKVKIDLLFETSWEVCNKIGGIYTVLSTKAKTLQKLYKDKNIFIGPDVWSLENESPYFIETSTPLDKWLSQANLPHEIKVRTGRWNIPGKPLVILVKFDTMFNLNNALFREMWNKFGVDSLHSYGDYGEACAFSHAAGIVIENICNWMGTENKRIIAHFDEWTTGMALLYTKVHLPSVATIFTTHATSIGRSICGNGKPLYDYLKGYNGDQMAGELNMEAKHSLEKTAAHNADCFTTVSDITAIECEQLLERRPDIVTPNGFENNFVPARSRFESNRKKARNTLINVASHLTGKQYPASTMLVATSGRCEYRNKGIDMFIDSLHKLKDNTLSRPIIAFVMVPAWSKEPRADLSEAIAGKQVSALADPVITHWLNNPNEDPIINSIHSAEFKNDSGSNVDIIYVPCYLNGADGIFNLTYYELLIGMDLTAFPSYYEPWGYTPLESIAFGVPTITTSLSGFGQWIIHTGMNDFNRSGVKVVERNDSNYSYTSNEIANAIKSVDNASAEILSEYSEAASATAGKAAWSYFIEYYIDSFRIALDKATARNN